jgi:transposase InsO family protein
MARKHGTGFRREVVRLALTSGLTRKQVAADLSIGLPTLSKWVQQDRHKDLMSGPHDDKEKEIARPDQVWCADITYIPVQRGFLYLVAIMDWARHILAWRLSNTMDAGFCIEVLNEVLSKYGKPEIFNIESGKSVHQLRLHRRSQGCGGHNLHGWAGPVYGHGQHLYRTPVAFAQVQGHLPARADRWLQG